MNHLSPYSLVDSNHGNSDLFYTELESFTNSILLAADQSLGEFAIEFSIYLTQNLHTHTASKNELLLQAMMPGIFWINYQSDALQTSDGYITLLKHMYSYRKQYPSLKNKIDKLRGFIGYNTLRHQSGHSMPLNSNSFSKLLNWLQATGEFNEEGKKLEVWRRFLLTKSEQYSEAFLNASIQFANYFSEEGKKTFGKYTYQWENFRENHDITYKKREDFFFTARFQNEYFLNMVGAEILNMELREAFNNTSQKVLLMPTCMRSAMESNCKAVFDGIELQCTSCDKNCNIGKIAIEMRQLNIPVYLIPHSSGFSKTLAKWKGKEDISLIGVACVLNLLTGGYEMKNLGISSQCVFLDYCGCKKHWHPEGVATGLNLNQLQKVINKGTDVQKVA